MSNEQGPFCQGRFVIDRGAHALARSAPSSSPAHWLWADRCAWHQHFVARQSICDRHATDALKEPPQAHYTGAMPYGCHSANPQNVPTLQATDALCLAPKSENGWSYSLALRNSWAVRFRPWIRARQSMGGRERWRKLEVMQLVGRALCLACFCVIQLKNGLTACAGRWIQKMRRTPENGAFNLEN